MSIYYNGPAKLMWSSSGEKPIFTRFRRLQRESQVKQFHQPESWFRELYFYDFVREQLTGYSTITFRCWLGERYLLLYRGERLAFPPTNADYADVVQLLSTMFKHGYYIPTLSTDSFLVSENTVLLADFQFDIIPSTIKRGEYIERIGELLGADINLLHELWQPVNLVQPPLTLEAYIKHCERLYKIYFQERSQMASSSLNYVVIPPFPPASDDVELTYPFVGKVHLSTEQGINELSVYTNVSRIDPEGHHHARLVSIYEVASNMLDKEDLEYLKSIGELSDPMQTLTQHVFEFTGFTLGRISDVLTWSNRGWFYHALIRLLKFIDTLHQHRIVHHDISSGNITFDGFLQLRLIDFGSANRVDDIMLNGECEDDQLDPDSELPADTGYIFYPVELYLLVRPETTADELRSINQRAQQQYRIHEKYLKVVGSDDFTTFRQQVLSLPSESTDVHCSVRKSTVLFAADLYGLGISLLSVLTDDYLNELKPVLYHLLVPDLEQRKVELAVQRLEDIVG